MTREEILNLASLCKLQIDDDVSTFIPDFEEMMAFAATINSAEADGSLFSGGVAEYGELRPDEVTKSLPQEEITSGVKAENGYFPVRRVVK